MSNLIIKASSQAVIPYLTYLVNLSFQNGKFREVLCEAKTLRLQKDEPETCENNCRPISHYYSFLKTFVQLSVRNVLSDGHIG